MWRRYLLWFAHEHVDFRNAELDSIISFLNIPIKFIEKPCVSRPYWIVELPSEECAKKIASRSVLLKNCIELWSRAKTEARLHENLKSGIKNVSNQWIIPADSQVNISDSHICPSELLEECSDSNNTFKVEVETFCKHFSIKEKVKKIEKFSYLPLEGPVKLKKPDITLIYIEFYGIDPNNVPEKPHDLFFGRWIADGQRELIQTHSLKKRVFIGNTSMDATLALVMANQARAGPGDLVFDPFVGSGSLFVAAAHFGAYVWGGDIDFMMLHGRTRPTRVGQKARGKDESIRFNMRQYGSWSRYLDVIVSDFSLPVWREGLTFDAIISDPPYGVREPTERIGIMRDNYTLSEDHLGNHIPAKVEYALPHMYSDLLTFAAKHLNIGKRLVCWYPIVRCKLTKHQFATSQTQRKGEESTDCKLIVWDECTMAHKISLEALHKTSKNLRDIQNLFGSHDSVDRADYKEEDLPTHPSLELVANSEQVLSKLTSRRLLTYEKISNKVSVIPPEPTTGTQNFREKYFAGGEITRKKRNEERIHEMAANLFGNKLSIPSKRNNNN